LKKRASIVREKRGGRRGAGVVVCEGAEKSAIALESEI
jgi:hypothetical protein